MVVESSLFQRRDRLEMARLIRAVPNLREDVLVQHALVEQLIDRLNQTVKRELRADRQEDHTMVPTYSAPRYFSASSGHWTRNRSAMYRTIRPDNDRRSTFVMLSTQTIFAPMSLPRKQHMQPAAAPVLRTTSGLSRRRIRQTLQEDLDDAQAVLPIAFAHHVHWPKRVRFFRTVSEVVIDKTPHIPRPAARS